MGKCVVFGMAGQDGTYLGELLRSQGHLIYGVSRSTGGDVANRQYVETLIKEIAPDIRVLFTSGYIAEVLDKELIQAKDVRLLHKPIPPDTLLKVVREVLDAGR